MIQSCFTIISTVACCVTQPQETESQSQQGHGINCIFTPFDLTITGAYVYFPFKLVFYMFDVHDTNVFSYIILKVTLKEPAFVSKIVK